MAISAQERARRSTEAMWSTDGASQWLGMEIVSVGPGTAVLKMEVQQHHTNGHGMCHGGITFALADSAFAFACNSYNQAVVAQHNSITYLAPAKRGDILTATATEVARAGRNGIYDVRVTNQNDTVIAEFRGNSRTIKGQHFEETT